MIADSFLQVRGIVPSACIGVRVSKFPLLPASPENAERESALSRRAVLAGLGAAALTAGCTGAGIEMPALQLDAMSTGAIRPQISVDKDITKPDLMYASFQDEGFIVPAVPYKKVKPEWRRQIVVDPTGEAPGTIVVRVSERHLYWVQPGGDAVRYGVGVGKDGFLWSGRGVIQYTKKWPTWTPPKEMIARKPEVAKWANGQPGGLTNPLGARALYIFTNGQDSGYRVHGSPEWWSIGTQASSGCIRLMNQDIVDLYNRVVSAPGKVPIVVA